MTDPHALAFELSRRVGVELVRNLAEVAEGQAQHYGPCFELTRDWLLAFALDLEVGEEAALALLESSLATAATRRDHDATA